MSENFQSIVLSYVPRIQKLYGEHLRKVILQGPRREENSVDEPDITLLIFVDLPDKEIEQYSESMSVICFDLLIEYSRWTNPVVKNINQFSDDAERRRFAEGISNEQIVPSRLRDGLL